MIQKVRLFTPGPTALHPAVQEAMARPILHHRTEEFRAIFKECSAGLKKFYKTEDDVLQVLDLPVLARIPLVHTTEDLAQLKRRKRIALLVSGAAGVAVLGVVAIVWKVGL